MLLLVQFFDFFLQILILFAKYLNLVNHLHILIVQVFIINLELSNIIKLLFQKDV